MTGAAGSAGVGTTYRPGYTEEEWIAAWVRTAEQLEALRASRRAPPLPSELWGSRLWARHHYGDQKL